MKVAIDELMKNLRSQFYHVQRRKLLLQVTQLLQRELRAEMQ